jgi:hypothetical protein
MMCGRKEVIMQKWEFMHLNIVYTPPFNGIAGDNYAIVTENCQIIPDMMRPKKKDVWEHVNALGQEGWELLSSQPIQMLETSTSRVEFHFVFKRRIED